MNRIWLPLILLILWILAFLFWLCPRCLLGLGGAIGDDNNEKTEIIKEPVKEAVKTATLSALAPLGLAISDGSSFATKAAKNIDFNASNYNYIAPLSADVNASLEKTSAYLKANPERGLTITGIYGNKEDNKSAFENLGLARANNVKQVLTKMGVSGKQLAISSALLGTNFSLKDIMYNGVKFGFGKISNDIDARLAAIKSKFLGKPLTLYFPTGKQEVNLTSQQRKDFSDLVFYLDNATKSSLEVSGHTDNKGAANVNKRLSRKRAEFVRDYLVGNGISTRRMSAKGFGPDRPIDTNDTDAGRSKNRRVEVTLR